MELLRANERHRRAYPPLWALMGMAVGVVLPVTVDLAVLCAVAGLALYRLHNS